MKQKATTELRRLLKQFISDTMRDIKNEGKDEFDKNFTRQAFFTERWARRRYDPDPTRSILIKSGRLRNNIGTEIQGDTIIFFSNEPYARLHNEGGEIEVTRRMKSYFWRLYYQAMGSRRYRNRKDKAGGEVLRNDKRNRKLSADAQFYRAMALKPVGSKIKMPKRQFIGAHPQFEALIRSIVIDNFINTFK